MLNINIKILIKLLISLILIIVSLYYGNQLLIINTETPPGSGIPLLIALLLDIVVGTVGLLILVRNLSKI